MSAPTPAPGDDRPREGYYPDPSIPGYVRYWNGAAWVPGTSRPAPSDGLSPGAGPSVEETGPHFFDEDPAPAHPEPASAWGADRAHQSGFGGAQDRHVSWGAPDPRVPADTPTKARRLSAAPPRAPPTGRRAGGAGRGHGERGRRIGRGLGRLRPGGLGRGGLRRAGLRRGRRRQCPGLRRRGVRPAGFTGGRPGAGGFGAQGPQGLRLGGRGLRPSGFGRFGRRGLRACRDRLRRRWPRRRRCGARRRWPAARRESARRRRPGARRELPGRRSLRPRLRCRKGAPPRGPPLPRPRPARQSVGTGMPAAQAQAQAQAGRAGAGTGRRPPRPLPRPSPAPAARPRRPPAVRPGAAPGGRRRHTHGLRCRWRAAPGRSRCTGWQGDEDGPWRPGSRPWRTCSRRRPGGSRRPGPRGSASGCSRGSSTRSCSAPSPPWPPYRWGTKAADHINEKIDAAKLSGRAETVWLLDGTTAAYLGIVLAVLLLFGVLYEALPTARWGRTLGKKLCGLEVRGIESHEPPGFGGALRRWLVYSVPGLLGIGIVGVAWCSLRPALAPVLARQGRTYVRSGIAGYGIRGT
ncbi:RDD family protein [Streptomyces sp. L7]